MFRQGDGISHGIRKSHGIKATFSFILAEVLHEREGYVLVKRILKDDFSIKMLSSSILFYLFFAFYDGTVICVDSPSYISMDRSREPFYPLLLALFRKIFGGFGGEGYLFGVVLFQSLLAALAAYAIVECARKEFKTSKIESVLILLLPLSVSLLCRFAAGRASMYSNSIMTEGIAIPLYLLFFCCLLEYVINYGLKSLMASVLLVFVLISTRKQMYITIPMLGVAILYVELKKKCNKKDS